MLPPKNAMITKEEVNLAKSEKAARVIAEAEKLIDEAINNWPSNKLYIIVNLDIKHINPFIVSEIADRYREEGKWTVTIHSAKVGSQRDEYIVPALKLE